ncbi:MAG: DEAD/DEAH box helicase, partial [Alphaproteobacteria bacterium]|nr:DEAD/DEAH box helicase [Alphaproteobacteria bacterium]
KADYLLRYAPAKAIAVVEAKRESESHLEGVAQAKEYAKKLGLWFAYATNGIEIEFFDLKTGKQQSVKQFHRPEDCASASLRGWEDTCHSPRHGFSHVLAFRR